MEYCSGFNRTLLNIIYKIPAGGGDATRLFDAEEEDFGLEYPAENINNISVSSDGSRLTFEISYYDSTRGSTYIKTDNMKKTSNGIPIILSVDTNTLEATILADAGYSPVCSPDGRYLLYRYFDYMIYIDRDMTENHGVPVLFDRASDTREFLELSELSDAGSVSFAFGPNSKFLYFSKTYHILDDSQMSYSFEFQLGRIPMTGGDIEILTERLQGYTCNLSISPDSRWMLFDNTMDVLILDIAKGTVYNALTGKLYTEPRENPLYSGNDDEIEDFFRYIYPVFLPDGLQFIYSIWSYSGVNSDYYIVDFDPFLYTGSEPDEPLSHDDSQPEAFPALSNFPNPFNLGTTLEFMLPEAGNVKLVIYDITGRNVRELADRFFTKGVHKIVWDGCGDTGAPVASGIYISHLTVGGRVVTNRMTFVK